MYVHFFSSFVHAAAYGCFFGPPVVQIVVTAGGSASVCCLILFCLVLFPACHQVPGIYDSRKTPEIHVFPLYRAPTASFVILSVGVGFQVSDFLRPSLATG